MTGGQTIPPGPPREHVNRPQRFRTLGWSAWREALRELWASRGACWWLTRREIVSRYRQSVLGVGWAVITPLAAVGVLLFLKRSDLIGVEDTRAPYAVFLCLGILPWQLFSACLTRATHSLSSAPHLVSRVRFPREVLVLSALGSALFDFLVGGVVLAGVQAWHGTAPAGAAVFLPAILLAQIAFGLALGLVLAVLNAAARDLGSMVPFALLLWMFLTPVLYPAATAGSGPGAWLSWLNPMAAFITAQRDLVLEGRLSSPGPLVLACILSLTLLPAAWRFFHLACPRVAESI
jgi:ABC-type polysaccharide/polyol phosphate export permease